MNRCLSSSFALGRCGREGGREEGGRERGERGERKGVRERGREGEREGQRREREKGGGKGRRGDRYHYDYWLDSAVDSQQTVIVHNNIIHDNESNNVIGSHTQSHRKLCLLCLV